jgi:toxin ParE1/3/4
MPSGLSDALVRKTFLLDELPLGTQSAGTRRRRSTGAVVVLNRILYEIKTTHIDIFAVIHKRRDLLAEEIPREL